MAATSPNPTPNPQTARQRLGAAIQRHVAEQRRTDREIADRCGCRPADVERFRAGTLVPERQTWTRMCQMVAKALFSYASLYREAMAEQEAEQELMLRSLRNHQPRSAATPPAPDQPASRPTPPAPAEPEPQPDERRARDGRRMNPARPPGSMTTEQVELRRDYVRRELRKRPHRRAEGPDGIITEVREVFGVGIAPAEVEAIRREVAREFERAADQHDHREQNPAAYSGAPTAPVAPAPAPAPAGEGDIAAAVALVVDAIPGLRRIVIEQDAAGSVTWTHEVHAVQHGRGTLQGRR